jgi:tetratricopeptide (TPR) repeat protein
MDLNKRISERVAAARKAKGLSLQKMVDLIPIENRISKQMLNQLEKGLRKWSIEHLEILSKAFGVSVISFFLEDTIGDYNEPSNENILSLIIEAKEKLPPLLYNKMKDEITGKITTLLLLQELQTLYDHSQYRALAERIREHLNNDSLLPKQKADLELRLADALRLQTKYAEAFKYYSNVINIYADLPNNEGKEGLAKASFGIADIHQRRAEFGLAIEKFEHIINSYGDIDNAHWKAESLFCIANIFSKLYKINEAHDKFKEALDIYIKNKYEDGITKSYQRLALIAYMQGDYAKALEYNGKSLEIAISNGNTRQEAIAIEWYGNIYLVKKQIDLAKEKYIESLRIYEAISDRLGVANSIKGLGNLESALNQYYKAQEYYIDAITLFEQMDAKADLAYISIDIGNMMLNLNRHFEASVFYKYSESFYRSQNVYQNVQPLISLEGNLRKQLGSEAKFSELMQESEKYLKDGGILSELLNITI